jgi:glycosyltransferase involved in cell wall biosynthesis
LFIKEEKVKKIKILTLSDHPLSPSGVGIQTKNMIEAMLKTGKYQFISFGGAIKHRNYAPTTTEEWGNDWVIYPVDGYGNQDMVRSALRAEKPDIVWFMTDPRFFGWLWEIENEIRPLAPMIYYHVWDNYPYPTFNKIWYDSSDVVATISKVTDDIVRNVSSEAQVKYIPHSVDTDVFKKMDDETVSKFKKMHFGEEDEDKVIFFWNNRNARRKQSGSLIFWFKTFLDKVGHDKAILLMHTDVKDPNGQDLHAIINELGLTDGQIRFSQDKLPFEAMATLYNVADCTINVSDAEGFGLATLESLSCETPIIVNMTGGLQEQVTDEEEWFGVGLQPSSRAIIGSQEIPWIYEDRLDQEQVVGALEKIYNMTKEERQELGQKGRAHVEKNYNFEEYSKNWDDLLTNVHENLGSWDTRKNYQSWKLMEI